MRAALVLFAFVLVPNEAFAHNNFEIDVTGGYRFASKIQIPTYDDQDARIGEGEYKVDGSFAFSGIAGYRLQPDGFIYLSYSRQETTSQFDDGEDGGTQFSGRTSVEYFQFGGNVEMTRGIFVPYLGFSVGLGRLAALGGGGARLFFAPALDAGIKIDLHNNVHLRFLARAPVLFTKGEVYCQSDIQCVEADTIRPMAQLEFHGGVGVSF